MKTGIVRPRDVVETVIFSFLLCFIAFLVMRSGAAEPPVVADVQPDIGTILGVPILTQLISTLSGKYGIVTAMLAWIGALRLVFKPFMSWIHGLVDKTETQRDNIILSKLEASTGFKVFAWFVDLLASIKFGPQRPIPSVDPKASNTIPVIQSQ